MKFELIKSPNPEKKYRAIFTKEDGTQTHTDFGAKGYQDYTIHKNPLRRKNYIQRHRTNENWSDPMSAGALSRYILWETDNLQKNIQLFKRRFNLE